MDNQDCQTVLTAPQLRLLGSVDEAMYAEFRNQLCAAPKDGPLVIALTTLGVRATKGGNHQSHQE